VKNLWRNYAKKADLAKKRATGEQTTNKVGGGKLAKKTMRELAKAKAMLGIGVFGSEVGGRSRGGGVVTVMGSIKTHRGLFRGKNHRKPKGEHPGGSTIFFGRGVQSDFRAKHQGKSGKKNGG